MESVVEDKRPAIDRQKTCPLLLRVFVNKGRHYYLSDFSGGKVPPNELQIYTWMDATLEELSQLVKEVHPDLRRKGTSFDFAFIFPEARGPGYRMRNIGQTVSRDMSPDDDKTLAQCRFQIGDYLSIAAYEPTQHGSDRFQQRWIR